VVDDPALNTREKLLEIAGKINQRYEWREQWTENTGTRINLPVG
jgi:hypothetical protein